MVKKPNSFYLNPRKQRPCVRSSGLLLGSSNVVAVELTSLLSGPLLWNVHNSALLSLFIGL